MPVTFLNANIDEKTFADVVLKQMVDGVFFGNDPPWYYAVLNTHKFFLSAVCRTAEKTWSAVVATLEERWRVVLNGNYFACSGCYAWAKLGDVSEPDEIQSIGDVKIDGSIFLKDNGDGKDYFYFGRTGTGTGASDYESGRGNPPAAISSGMGGLGPLIGTVGGRRCKYGVGNLYEPGVEGPVTGDPGDKLNKLVQRNNNTYKAMNSEKSSGMGVVGVCAAREFLITAVKPHGSIGTLDVIRDRLWSVGVDHACFTDGSNSVCMAVDRKMVIAPAEFKDALIEVGIGFSRFGS